MYANINQIYEKARTIHKQSKIAIWSKQTLVVIGVGGALLLGDWASGILGAGFGAFRATLSVLKHRYKLLISLKITP